MSEIGEVTEASVPPVDQQPARWPRLWRGVAASALAVVSMTSCGSLTGNDDEAIRPVHDRYPAADIPATLEGVARCDDEPGVVAVPLDRYDQQRLAIAASSCLSFLRGRPKHVEQVARLRQQLDGALTDPEINGRAHELIDARMRLASLECVPLFKTNVDDWVVSGWCDEVPQTIRDPEVRQAAIYETDLEQVRDFATSIRANSDNPDKLGALPIQIIADMMDDSFLQALVVMAYGGDHEATASLIDQTQGDIGKTAREAERTAFNRLLDVNVYN